MNFYKAFYPFFKKFAFKLDPERVHELTIHGMKLLGPKLKDSTNQYDFKVEAFGLSFKSPFGLAAGLDKNAEAIDYLTTLPFGFIEVGTVTKLAQSGNEKPRLFRLIEFQSLRNRMGFNNHGSKVVISNILKSNKRNKILGVNLGKNKATSNQDAHLDYSYLYKLFASNADYLVINVSSPNTPGLRNLLSEKGLREIFEAVSVERKLIDKPLFVKISPDMSFEQIDSVISLVSEFKLTGIIATNTTIIPKYGEGGISGKLLYERSKEIRNYLLEKMPPSMELIGVGGFFDFEEIKDFWSRGGKLVQIYTAFIFEGPDLLLNLEEKLLLDFKKYQVENFQDYLIKIRAK